MDWWNKPTLHSSGFWILHTYSSCNFAGKIWQQKCTEKIMHASFRSGNWNYCCCHCKLFYFLVILDANILIGWKQEGFLVSLKAFKWITRINRDTFHVENFSEDSIQRSVLSQLLEGSKALYFCTVNHSNYSFELRKSIFFFTTDVTQGKCSSSKIEVLTPSFNLWSWDFSIFFSRSFAFYSSEGVRCFWAKNMGEARTFCLSEWLSLKSLKIWASLSAPAWTDSNMYRWTLKSEIWYCFPSSRSQPQPKPFNY